MFIRTGCGTRFSMRTLEYLVTGHYRQAAKLVRDTDADAALVFYLTKADPLLVLRDLLGHSTVLTTEKVPATPGYDTDLPGSLRDRRSGERHSPRIPPRSGKPTPSSTTTPTRCCDADDG